MWVELDANDISLEFAYKNNQVHLESENGWAVSFPLFTASGSLLDVLNFGADTAISFEGSGKGDAYFDASIKEGYYLGLKFDVWNGLECMKVGWIDDRNFDIADTDAKGEFYIAYDDDTFANIIDVIGLSAGYKAGFVIDGETSKNHEYSGEPDTWHACDDEKCICGNSHVRFGPLSLSGTVFDNCSYTFWHTDLADLDPFMRYYVSETFGDKDMHGQCPYKGYKVNAEVVNKEGDPLAKVDVSYKDVPDHFDPVASGETGNDGKTTLYAPTGDYEVTAELVSSRDPSIKISQALPIKKDTSIQDFKFTLDIPTKHVYFKNSSSGDVSKWPKDIPFQPFFSTDVHLPDAIPSMSGRQFAGWNTKEDGTGTSYVSGVFWLT